MEPEATFVLDTNIISAVLREEEIAVNHLRTALLANAVVLICPLVFYEIKRGLRKRDAWKQLYFFEQLAAQFMRKII